MCLRYFAGFIPQIRAAGKVQVSGTLGSVFKSNIRAPALQRSMERAQGRASGCKDQPLVNLFFLIFVYNRCA